MYFCITSCSIVKVVVEVRWFWVVPNERSFNSSIGVVFYHLYWGSWVFWVLLGFLRLLGFAYNYSIRVVFLLSWIINKRSSPLHSWNVIGAVPTLHLSEYQWHPLNLFFSSVDTQFCLTTCKSNFKATLNDGETRREFWTAILAYQFSIILTHLGQKVVRRLFVTAKRHSGHIPFLLSWVFSSPGLCL